MILTVHGETFKISFNLYDKLNYSKLIPRWLKTVTKLLIKQNSSECCKFEGKYLFFMELYENIFAMLRSYLLFKFYSGFIYKNEIEY